MSGHSIFNGQRFSAYLCCVCCVLLVILTAGCGDKSSNPATADNVTADSSGTGSASFSIRWNTASDNPVSADALVRQAIDHCSAAGVETITCKVYDPSNTLIASDGPWACEDHGASMERIPAGSNLTFAVLGWDADANNIVYQGQIPGITIAVGQVENVGTIDAYAFVPTGLEATAISSSRIDLVWNAPDEGLDVDGYGVYRNGTMVATTELPEYSDTHLTPDTEYCYTVSALDAFGNESGHSDQDCDKTPPNITWYRDADGDSYGDPNDSTVATDQPDGYVADNTDCDDGDTSIHPNATETCNEIDDNCDGNIDEGVLNTYYIDSDGDGYGDASDTIQACTAPTGYVADNTDCDNENNTIYPGAPELNDGLDNDCDGGIDEDWDIYYRDADGDFYGDPNDSVEATSQPEGYVPDNTDCNDDNASVHPNATEVCNGIDDNCIGGTDEGCNTYYRDADGDSYGDPNVSTRDTSQPEGYVSNNTDCDDDDGSVHPNATEVCNNIDDNCNGRTDEGCNTYYRDADGDAYGDPNNSTQDSSQPEGYVSNNTDCDDEDASVHPNAAEVCNNIDDNCNGRTDEGCNTYYRDADGDTFGNPNDSIQNISRPEGYVSNNTDCDDDNASVHPNATEVCNGIDDNCAGGIDEGLSTDADGDRHYAPGSCFTPADDCDDSNPNVNPGATEVCNGIDDNCAGGIDEGLSTDADDDGHYTFGSCLTPADDCDDNNANINPEIPETDEDCGDGIDQDCSGTDLSCDDVDNDRDRYSENQGDCDDSNPNVNPDAIEVCNGIDDNCIDGIDEGCPECYENIATPQLVLTSIERAPTPVAAIYIYNFTVSNRAAYPDEMFMLSSAYPSCNEYDGSRTIVEMYDIDHNLITEFCDFTSPNDLEILSFTSVSNPRAVYINIYDQECETDYTSNTVSTTVTSAPVQISPEDGSVFDHYPRTTTLQWQTVAGASSYSVEIDCYWCCGNGWCTDLGETWDINTGIQDNTFTFNFVGAQPGRWRVWAVDFTGNNGPRSGWWEFEYLR